MAAAKQIMALPAFRGMTFGYNLQLWTPEAILLQENRFFEQFGAMSVNGKPILGRVLFEQMIHQYHTEFCLTFRCSGAIMNPIHGPHRQ